MKLVTQNYTENKNIKVAQSSHYMGNDNWTWAIWIDAPEQDLDSIDAVVYTLHPSFNPPVIRVSSRSSQFRFDTRGWGTFTIYIRVYFKDQSVMDLEHDLELNYPFEEETPKEEVKNMLEKSPDYQKIYVEIESMKSELERTELPEYKSSIKKRLELKQAELENLRSNINSLYQIFNSTELPADPSKVEHARTLFDQGDYLAASEAME